MTYAIAPRPTLGYRTAVGKLSAANRILSGAWVVTFAVDELPRQACEVWHGAIRGPGGYFQVWLDESLYGVGANGLINEYAPTIPMYVSPGQTITFHWSTVSTPAPQAWLYFRQPEVGK